jgi:hypothetical protein
MTAISIVFSRINITIRNQGLERLDIQLKSNFPAQLARPPLIAKASVLEKRRECLHPLPQRIKKQRRRKKKDAFINKNDATHGTGENKGYTYN